MAESYLVELAPRADLRRSALGAVLLLQLERIMTLLSVRPYPRPNSELIRREEARGIYSYRDGQFPFAIEYRIFEPETGTIGLVVIADLVEDQ